MHRHSGLTIFLHWLIAALIITALAMGFYMVDLSFSMTKLKLFNWHKWLGVSIFFLVILRLFIRLSQGVPAYPDSMPRWEKRAAALSHLVLYVLMFAVPISGYLYTYAAGIPVVYFAWIELPALIGPFPALKLGLKELHDNLTFSLLIVVLLHLAAALKHRLIDRDKVLQGMLPRFFSKD
ncbi:MAG: cytochrome b [Undibacterium sp.]|nr:cytochrome b [Undibacterium sp.]